MNMEKEFKKYVKDFSNKMGYDISNEELNTMYKGFFYNEIDMMFEKQQELNKEIETGKENEYGC